MKTLSAKLNSIILSVRYDFFFIGGKESQYPYLSKKTWISKFWHQIEGIRRYFVFLKKFNFFGYIFFFNLKNIFLKRIWQTFSFWVTASGLIVLESFDFLILDLFSDLLWDVWIQRHNVWIWIIKCRNFINLDNIILNLSLLSESYCRLNSFNFSEYVFLDRPDIEFTALIWTCSSIFEYQSQNKDDMTKMNKKHISKSISNDFIFNNTRVKVAIFWVTEKTKFY